MAKQATARVLQLAQAVEQALTLHRAGRLAEADQIYRDILATDPHHVAAMHLSGVLKHQQGQSGEALRLVGAALQAQPGSADVLTSYGAILIALSRYDEALARFDAVLALRPDDAGAHYNRGNALGGLGRHGEALASYDRALAAAPGLTEPGFTDALYNRGNALAALDRNQEAAASFEAALIAEPDRTDTLTNYGTALLALERCDEALASFDKALARDPDNVVVLLNRGTALIKLKRPAEAQSNYDRVLAIDPASAAALDGRGRAFAALGRFAEALDSHDQALRVTPGFVAAHVGRGNALHNMKRMEEARASYAAALAINPQDADANFNAALNRLCLGDFRDGWKQYEYRWDRKEYRAHRPNFPRPQWRGEKDLQGKVVLLTAEQGLGDAIQFVRYAPWVAALGAKVILGVHRPLAALMASVPGVSQVIADGETLPPFDLYCPLLSLPLAFETELATIPANVPYIGPSPERIARWRDRLPPNDKLRIGICWAGNSTHLNDRNRSVPLERFATLLSGARVDFVNLQKEVGASDTAILSQHGVHQLGQEFVDFADTAAVIAMLDLVISVDTSVAHLAGAMAKAVAVLIPFSPDFRWMLDRTDSPWYPTMRLFRQSAVDDWGAPLERLCRELAALASRPPKPR